MKFIPNHRILPEGFPTSFLEYLSPRATVSPPHPSPLAANLLNVDGVTSVFYGIDFITVTKASDANWAHIKPEVFSLITQTVSSGETIVNTVAKSGGEHAQEGGEAESLSATDEDDEVIGMIKELLETRIRPAIQEDGGDIEFRGFENGMVMVKLRGACRTCDSSTVTLKNGIESMLMHYVSGSACGCVLPTDMVSDWFFTDRGGQGRGTGSGPGGRGGDARVCKVRGEIAPTERTRGDGFFGRKGVFGYGGLIC